MTLRTWGAGSSARCAAVPLSSWAHHACARLSPGPPALLALLTKIVFLLLFAVVTLRKKKKKAQKLLWAEGDQAGSRAVLRSLRSLAHLPLYRRSRHVPHGREVAAAAALLLSACPRGCESSAGRSCCLPASCVWPRAAACCVGPASWCPASIRARCLPLPPELCTVCHLVRPDAGCCCSRTVYGLLARGLLALRPPGVHSKAPRPGETGSSAGGEEGLRCLGARARPAWCPFHLLLWLRAVVCFGAKQSQPVHLFQISPFSWRARAELTF